MKVGCECALDPFCIDMSDNQSQSSGSGVRVGCECALDPFCIDMSDNQSQSSGAG